jgi:hypothetical protein
MTVVQTTGVASSPQRKKNFRTSKQNIYLLFMGHFCRPGSGSVPNADPDPADRNQNGSVQIQIQIRNTDQNY